MAIVAVAAHLLKQNIGEDYGLKRLSEKHQHDFGSLDQVFWHILTRLSYYRELHVRSQAPLDTTVGQRPLLLWKRSVMDSWVQVPECCHVFYYINQGLCPLSFCQGSGPQLLGRMLEGGREVVSVSEVDSFASRLNAILVSDMSQVRCSGGGPSSVHPITLLSFIAFIHMTHSVV